MSWFLALQVSRFSIPSSNSSQTEARLAALAVSFIALAFIIATGLLCWKVRKRRQLLFKYEKEIEEYPDVAQMPVLLKHPASAHLRKSL